MSKDRIYIILSRKLSGEATSSELAELNELLKLHKNMQLPAQFIEGFWNSSEEKDVDFLEATYHLHLDRLKQRGHDLEHDELIFQDNGIELPINLSTKKKNKNLLLVTLIAGFVVVIGSFLYISKKRAGIYRNRPDNNVTAESEISTKNGSRTKIQLPDGTSVWLNGSSKLIYDNRHFGETVREVTLTGEGYFDVVKNHDKPFIIHTAKMDIKVLGTAFNVKCYPGEKTTETSLIRGSIEVTLKNRKDKIMLRPSEKLVINNDDIKGDKKEDEAKAIAGKNIGTPIIVLTHLTRSSLDSSVVETAWVENRLVFSSETFEDVALKMEKWYGTHISFANEKILKEKLTGTFEKETVNEALKALQLTTHFNYKIFNDTIIISN